jgi:hypothetical protein
VGADAASAWAKANRRHKPLGKWLQMGSQMPSKLRVAGDDKLTGLCWRFAALSPLCRPHPWAPKALVEFHFVNAMLKPLDICMDMLAFRGAPTL